MSQRALLLGMLLVGSLVGPLCALDYPAPADGETWVSASQQRLTVSTSVLHAEWIREEDGIVAVSLQNKYTDQLVRLNTGCMPRIVLEGDRTIDLAAILSTAEVAAKDGTLSIRAKDDISGLAIHWSVAADGTGHCLLQTLELTATKDTTIEELVFVDAAINGAKQVGQVDGSVVVCGDIFLAVEHPLARNIVSDDYRVRCALPRGNVLPAGKTWEFSSVIGVVEPGQLRRGFLAYLEQRRAQPYRPFLHYNNWYDVVLARSTQRVTEPECLQKIEFFGRELVEKRGVKLDAFVWDDGWDDFNSLWRFHPGFPNGLKKLNWEAAKFKAAQGVWMSPWGGYASAKEKRIAFGRPKGYETNAGGFSMAGEKYQAAFRDVCLNMMREQGVVFFKFDGMGGGNETTGPRAEMADDVDAVLELTKTLREENPKVFISATIGTWASPFWTLYADSIWRQGGDTGYHGGGNTRQQWITYRDMYCYARIVQRGPLYPLNSLMLHGPTISDRSSPAKMVRDEKSVADEIWSFFGSGTNLQELYITPRVLTPKMWDELAAAARWSRANSDVLVDTHWIGGNPGNGEIYGWASWQPGKAIVTLRNPSAKPARFALDLVRDLELPARFQSGYQLSSPRSKQRAAPKTIDSKEPLYIEMQSWEVLVFEAMAVSEVDSNEKEKAWPATGR